MNLGKLESLKFPEALFRQLAIHPPAENTCQWLTDTESFGTWIERSKVNSHLGFLQIIGKPGSGKSTLMGKAFDTTRALFSANTGICVLSHFFDRRGKPLQHSATGILRSLLYQLGNQYPASLRSFRDFSLPQLEPPNPKFYLSVLKVNLEEIFSTLSLAPQRTIIFVDALDECDPGDVVEVVYFLAELTRHAHSKGIELDVCVSRREYPYITIKDSLEIHMDSYNGDDIKQYMYQKFEMADIPSGDRELLIKTISQRSNSIFLWVVLTVEGVLTDFRSGQNMKYILDRTESLPTTLENLYEQIITGMALENREMALRLFQWAVLATDRLRIREWHHILAFIRENPPASLKEWKDSDYYTETDSQLELRIRNLSQGLIEVKGIVDKSAAASDSGSLRAGAGSLDSTIGDSRVVQPIHETVTEFFTSGRANWLYMKGTSYDFHGGGHLFITSTCLNYICIAELDGLIRARQLPENSKVRISRGRSITRKEKKWLHGRSRSATSFMSSASSHSGKYRFQDQDDGMDDTLDGEDELLIMKLASPRTRSGQSGEIEHLRSSWRGPSPPDSYKTDSIPPPEPSPMSQGAESAFSSKHVESIITHSSSEMGSAWADRHTRSDSRQLPDQLTKIALTDNDGNLSGCVEPFENVETAKWLSSLNLRELPLLLPLQTTIPASKGKSHGIWAQNQNVGSSISACISSHSSANSLISHTLEGYPALKSYAVNRAFEHARAGLALGADPGDVLRKLVLQKCWERWYMLQEHAPRLYTWKDVLYFHNLGPWISIAEKIL